MIAGDIHWLTPLYALIPMILALIAILWRGHAVSLDMNLLSDGLKYKHPLLKLIPQKHRSPKQRWLQWLLLGWLCLMLSLALAQPVRIGEKLPDLPPERDIVLLVDISISMTLKDYEFEAVRVSRLDVLKSLLHEFVGRLQGERLAMIVFAENPHLLVPLTRDQTLIQRQMARLKSTMAGRISALGDAIVLGLKEAAKRPQRKQIFVLFTDVDESIGRVTPQAAAELALESGIPLYTIAIGTTAKSINSDNENNKNSDKEDDGGLLYQPVNLNLLKSIATRTGAASYEAGDAQAIEQALSDINQLQKNEAEQRPRFEQVVLYPFLLVLGIFPLVLLQVLGQISGIPSRGQALTKTRISAKS